MVNAIVGIPLRFHYSIAIPNARVGLLGWEQYGRPQAGWGNGARHERGMEESVDILRSDSRASRTEGVIMITFFTFT